MVDEPVALKVLLRARHWTYATFCAQYDRAAKALDPRLGPLAGGHHPRAVVGHEDVGQFQDVTAVYATRSEFTPTSRRTRCSTMRRASGRAACR